MNRRLTATWRTHSQLEWSEKVDRRAIACVLAHFDIKRQSVNPTAMGRIPPDFLFKAINRPPKKMGATIFT